MSISKNSLQDPKLKEALEKELEMQIDKANPILEVGFFKDAKYPNGKQVAQVASENEFGTHSIPPRPFFRNAIKKNSQKWIETFKKNAKEKPPYEVMGMLGEVIRSDIVLSINQTNTPPNSPYTIRKKKSSKPLVDSGKMRASVDYSIRSK